jgi:hypothetical protein
VIELERVDRAAPELIVARERAKYRREEHAARELHWVRHTFVSERFEDSYYAFWEPKC